MIFHSAERKIFEIVIWKKQILTATIQKKLKFSNKVLLWPYIDYKHECYLSRSASDEQHKIVMCVD